MKKQWKRDTTYFLASQSISLIGSALVQYAIMWHITLETKSGFMMAISIACGFLPTFFMSPFAGVWADRYNRKKLIILSDALIAISTLVLVILFTLGYNVIGLLFVASAIRALGSGIQTPAVNAFLPGIVPEDKLTRVNSINGTIQSMITLLAPMLSGALMSVTSMEVIFSIDVITAVIAIVILMLFLHVPAHTKAMDKQKINYFTDLREGIRYIVAHDFISTLFLFCAVYFILVAPLAFLTPLQVTRSFGDDVWRLTAIEVTFSIGMVAGGILMASWGGFKRKLYTMVLSVLVIAVCTIMLGTIPVFWIYLLFMVITGMVMPMFNTPFMVLLQQKVEQDYLGRVFGVLGMISSAIMPLAMLVYGPLADRFRIEWMLVITGLLILIQGFVMLKSKVLIKAGI